MRFSSKKSLERCVREELGGAIGIPADAYESPSKEDGTFSERDEGGGGVGSASAMAAVHGRVGGAIRCSLGLSVQMNVDSSKRLWHTTPASFKVVTSICRLWRLRLQE
jgi:hypothetical protein